MMNLGFRHYMLVLGVSALDTTKAQSSLCNGYTDVLSHIVEISMNITSYPTDPDTFIHLSFGSDGGPYANMQDVGAWCVDFMRTYDDKKINIMVDTMSSYDPIVSGAGKPHLVSKPENLDLVNWLINHYPTGSTISVPDCDGTTGLPATGQVAQVVLRSEEYQNAIWELVDLDHQYFHNFTHPQLLPCVSDYLVELAETSAEAASFEPDCNDKNKIGVLIFEDQNSETHEANTFNENDILSQVFMAEIELSSIEGVCVCKQDGTVYGDPHFKTWSGEKYDFHGVCDLTLLQNNQFMNGLGMRINVRSKRMQKHYTYVSSAAIRIGSDTFEVAGRKDGDTYWLNGKQGPRGGALEEMATIAGYPITFHQVHSHQREYKIQLSEEETISFVMWKDFVRVDVNGARDKSFHDSLGLLGSFNQVGTKFGRDGITVIDDINQFAQEWQVLASEPTLFHEVEGPQHPALCEIPSETVLRRRLAESSITTAEAELACSHVKAEERGMCAFDVMATNDKSVAGAY